MEVHQQMSVNSDIQSDAREITMPDDAEDVKDTNPAGKVFVPSSNQLHPKALRHLLHPLIEVKEPRSPTNSEIVRSKLFRVALLPMVIIVLLGIIGAVSESRDIQLAYIVAKTLLLLLVVSISVSVQVIHPPNGCFVVKFVLGYIVILLSELLSSFYFQYYGYTPAKSLLILQLDTIILIAMTFSFIRTCLRETK